MGVSNSAPADCPLKALPLTGMNDAEIPRLVEPAAHIHDYIGTSKFRISPTAFFQVRGLQERHDAEFVMQRNNSYSFLLPSLMCQAFRVQCFMLT